MRFASPLALGVGLLVAGIAAAGPGALDPSFGLGGKVTTPVSSGRFNDEALALARQPNGMLVAAGSSSTAATSFDFALVRYRPDGSVDKNFGPGHLGIVRTSIGRGEDRAQALVLQPDGKLVAAGSTVDESSTTKMVLVRYNANGSRDTSFGASHSGIVTTSFGPDEYDEANALVLQPDGKLVAAGTSSGRFGLVRYLANGRLDRTFGPAHSGKVTTRLGSGSVEALALVRQPDGKLVVAGGGEGVNGNPGHFALVRYNANGSLDTTFGNQGKALTPIGPSDNAFAAATALALQPDGKLVAAGFVENNFESSPDDGEADLALARYNTNGSLDTSFGTGGKIDRPHIPGKAFQKLYALAVQPDGKLVAAGFAEPKGTALLGFLLVRYQTNGQPDTTFGTGGRLTTPIGTRVAQAKALILQPDGRLAAAGETWNRGVSTGSDFALARYLP